MSIDGTLLYGIVTLGCGFLALCVRYAFKSKCSNVTICYGCVTLERDVRAEIELEENGIGQSPKRQQSFDNAV